MNPPLHWTNFPPLSLDAWQLLFSILISHSRQMRPKYSQRSSQFFRIAQTSLRTETFETSPIFETSLISETSEICKNSPPRFHLLTFHSYLGALQAIFLQKKVIAVIISSFLYPSDTGACTDGRFSQWTANYCCKDGSSSSMLVLSNYSVFWPSIRWLLFLIFNKCNECSVVYPRRQLIWRR